MSLFGGNKEHLHRTRCEKAVGRTLINVFECKVEWSEMKETPCVDIRHCDQCEKDVFDFTGKTLEEMRIVIKQNDGLACGMAYLREDGRVVDGQCAAYKEPPPRVRIGRIAVSGSDSYDKKKDPEFRKALATIVARQVNDLEPGIIFKKENAYYVFKEVYGKYFNHSILEGSDDKDYENIIKQLRRMFNVQRFESKHIKLASKEAWDLAQDK